MAKELKYSYKLYSIDGQTIKTLSQKLIIDKPQFVNSINSWPTWINLRIPLNFDTSELDWFAFIEISEYNEDNKAGRNLFAGSIESRPSVLDESQNITWLECKWLHTLLSKVYYKSWWSIIFSKNDTLNNIVTELVNYFNSLQQWNPWPSYNWFIGTDLIKVWTMPSKTVNLDFSYTNCLDALIEIFEAAWVQFYITPDWTINAFEKPTSPTHRFVLKNKAQNLEISNANKYELINKVYVERNWWTIKEYEDTTSQNTYWIREVKIDKTNIRDETTQDQFGNSYIEENKDPKREITVTINNKYDISSINPGETITLLNSDIDIQNIQILRTSYNWDTMVLNLEKYKSLWKILRNNV